MTTPAPVTPASLLNEVKSAIAAVEATVTFVEKFDAFLPSQYQATLAELSTVLTTVQGFLSKF